MNKPALEGLLERLEKCEGPDREIDFWISARIYNPSHHTDAELQADIDAVGIEGMVIEAPYTASLDACIALVERVLPGYRWHLHSVAYVDGAYQGDGIGRADIHSPLSSGWGPKWFSCAPGYALPLLTATVKALIAETKNK